MKIKLLVAEDDQVSQFLLKAILDHAGFAHDMVDNGLSAVEKLRTNVYDVVLLDLQMPGLNGLEVAEFIRHHQHAQTPIMLITADTDDADLQRCIALKISHRLNKPVEENTLVEKIKALIPVHCTDLDWLRSRTVNKTALMKSFIELFLEQIPILIDLIKKDLAENDWDSLRSGIHRLLPSLSIVGIAEDVIETAKLVHRMVANGDDCLEMREGVEKIITVCTLACAELGTILKELKE